MSTRNPHELSGPDFERRLLDSARADPLPQNVQIAWANFAGALRLAASHVEPSSGLHAIKHPEHARGGITQSVRAGLSKAATWFVVGAIGGSALTAGLLTHRRAPSDHSGAAAQLAPAVVAPSKEDSTLQSSAIAPAAFAVASDAQVATSRQPSVSHAKSSRQSSGANLVEQGVADGGPDSTPSPTSGTSNLPLAEGAESTLAAQVRQLDAARTAYRIGAYNDAIRLVEDYHREFPNGALAPDADVVTIEALVGKQDRSAAARHAHAFLAKYPKDPHATLVRQWAER